MKTINSKFAKPVDILLNNDDEVLDLDNEDEEDNEETAVGAEEKEFDETEEESV